MQNSNKDWQFARFSAQINTTSHISTPTLLFLSNVLVKHTTHCLNKIYAALGQDLQVVPKIYDRSQHVLYAWLWPYSIRRQSNIESSKEISGSRWKGIYPPFLFILPPFRWRAYVVEEAWSRCNGRFVLCNQHIRHSPVCQNYNRTSNIEWRSRK
jgi:hypothetical protein